MTWLLEILAVFGRWSSVTLVAGLACGLAVPQAAAGLRPHLTLLIVALLFFASLRVDPRAVGSGWPTLVHDVSVVIILQFLLPVVLAALLMLAGQTGSFASMLILVAAAAPITGSAPIAQMLGQSGALAMRLLLWGTLLLPLTSIVPLRFAFGTAAGYDVLVASLRLGAIIAFCVCGAAVIRFLVLGTPSPRVEQALGGLTAILLAVFVVALMDAIQPALFAAPVWVAGILASTFAANFGLQIAAALAYRRLAGRGDEPGVAGAVGVVAGNRNIALFLAALPAAQIEPLMVLVGCYQIPMFLTPILMRPVYGRISEVSAVRRERRRKLER